MDNEITSDTPIPIEQHFRVSAGPGAGKTHWLVNHIKNVLHASRRLSKTRKIACITYTNIAASTILSRLGTSSNRVDVSTIHSFLYINIVKPYLHFIADEYNVNVNKVSGHDDIILSNYSLLNELKKSTKQERITDDKKLNYAISQARWILNSRLELEINTPYPIKIDKYAIKKETFSIYKRLAWDKGVLHHDDVLFFSYQLVKKHPFILNILNAKYPYFYIDEFQDSNPIQIKIVEMIAQGDTKIGIIGDKAQSIYGFQGARVEQFDEFHLNKLINYTMLDNRRSTNRIIDVLNIIRPEFKQNYYKNINGDFPSVFVGNKLSAFLLGQKICKSERLYTLTFKNVISNTMKKEIGENISEENLLSNLLDIDSNKDRKQTIYSSIKATELALYGNYKEAIKELSKIVSKYNSTEETKKEALKYLYLLMNQHKNYNNKSLIEYHAFISNNFKKLPIFRAGTIKTFYENSTYQQLAIHVNIQEDHSLHRTIHKSKGDEFDNVMIILNDESELEFLINPNLNIETHRVFYVAASRAKNNLFIQVPTISDDLKNYLSNLHLKIYSL